MKRILISLLLAIAASTAQAQPGPPPSPFLQTGQSIAPRDPASCLVMPGTVTGGCKGAGTGNFTQLYVNGTPVGVGSGSVSSVGLALPTIFTVSGSPVTTTGTLSASLNNQSANRVFAGPTSGGSAIPAFRALVGADLPAPGLSTLGGIMAVNAVSHLWISSITTGGAPVLTQPAFSDITGILGAAAGGTGINSSASSGVATVSSGTWSIASSLSTSLGGTGINSSAASGVAVITAGSWAITTTLPNGLAMGTPASLVLTNATNLPNTGMQHSSMTFTTSSTGLTVPGTIALGASGTIGAVTDSIQFTSLGLGVGAPGIAGLISTVMGANNVIGLKIKRFTDTAPTGKFADFLNAAGTSLWTVDITGTVTVGAWGATVISSTKGGAGSVSGILKANGSGVVSAAASGTDFAPATSGSVLLLGNGAGGFSNYAGTSCTNQFTRSISTVGVATCNSVANADLVGGTYASITGVGTLTTGATGSGFTVALTTSTITGNLPLANNSTFANYGQTSGMVCNGSTDDRAALNTANGVSGTNTITITGGTCVIGSNITITKQLVFMPGAMLSPNNGVVITLSHVPNAPPSQQIFANALSGQGSVVLANTGGSANPAVYPEWWGAIADKTVTDNAPMAQAAADSLKNGGTVLFGPGYYKMGCASTDAMTISNDYVNVRGSGAQSTKLLPATNCAHFLIRMNPPNQSGDISGIEFDGEVIHAGGVTYSSMQWGAIWCSLCVTSTISELQGFGVGTFFLGDKLVSSQLRNWEVVGGSGTGFAADGNGACIQLGGAATSPSGVQQFVSIDDFDNIRCFGAVFAIFNGSITGTTLTASAIQGTIEVGQWVAGASPGTKIVSGSGSTWTVSISQSVSTTPMNSSAGYGLIMDSGTNEQTFRRFTQGANYGGILIQNTYAANGAHRPENIRITDGTNISGNGAFGAYVASGWTIELYGTSLNGTYVGPSLYVGPPGNSYTASISGTTLTVSGAVTGAPIAAGQPVNCNGCLQDTYIVSGSGTTWTVSPNNGTVGSTTFNNVAVDRVNITGGEVVSAYYNDNLIMRAACNLSIKNAESIGAGASQVNTNSAIRITSYACGNVEILGNMMGDIEYGNFHNTQAYALVLESGSLATKVVSGFNRIGRINAQMNMMAGNQTDAISDLGTSASGFGKLIANNILQ